MQIFPERNAHDVRTSAPLHIWFDRPVDQRSVGGRFELHPGAPGEFRWQGDRELVFEHRPLRPSTTYEVALAPGYRDSQGNVSSLRHSWKFSTEAAPTLTGATPGPGDRGVDPAAYLSLSFSREMDLATLAGSISVSPYVRFSLRHDPGDVRRVILAPDALLEPARSYTVAVTSDARDIDGNQLRAGRVVSFSTGELKTLKHWIGFIVEPAPGTDGEGVWIVDENRFPRQLVNAPVDLFSWSPDATHLLLRSPAGSWSDQPLAGTGTQLPFAARWAAFLAPGRGYVYLDEGSLRLLTARGDVVEVAAGVGEAAVAPGGTRLAFTVGSHPGSQIDGYDVDLHARYRLQTETALVDGLDWSPDGQALAYRLLAADPQKSQIRARLLSGSARTVTVATGEVSTPAWQADSRHLIFTAAVQGPAGTLNRAFRLAAGDPPPRTLAAAQGMPAAVTAAVRQASPSPDGHQIAFLSDYEGRSAVFLMNADGTNVTRVSEFDPAGLSYSCRAVAWTPS